MLDVVTGSVAMAWSEIENWDFLEVIDLSENKVRTKNYTLRFGTNYQSVL